MNPADNDRDLDDDQREANDAYEEYCCRPAPDAFTREPAGQIIEGADSLLPAPF